MRAVVLAAAAYALVGGAISFSGWVLDRQVLTDWFGTGVSIQPNAALLMLLAGAALILLQIRRAKLAAGLAAFIAVAGGLTLTQYMVGSDFGINHQLLFGREWGSFATVTRGRMGPPASSSFTLIGTCLVILSLAQVGWRPAAMALRLVPALALIVCTFMLFSHIGYVVGAREFYTLPWLTAIALQTASMLMGLGVALIASVPQHNPVQLLREKSGAAMIARWALPTLIILPALVFWLRSRGQSLRLYDEGTGRALALIVLIIVGVALMWWALKALRRHESALRDSEVRYRTLFEVAVHGIITMDNRGIIDSANGAAERIFGWTASELVGRNISTLMAEPYRAEHASYLQKFTGFGERKIIGVRREVVGLRKDGSSFPMELAVSEFSVSGRRFLLSAVTDISQRKRAEETLRQSEARLRSIIEQLPAGVGVMDIQGRWLLTNSTMDQYVPRSLPSVLPDRPRHWRFWDDEGRPIPSEEWPGVRALRGQTVVPGIEGLYTDDDGRELWMRVSAAPLYDDANQIIGATCVVQDVDLARRFQDRLQEELSRRTEEVERAARTLAAAQRMAAVGTMASGLAHDLKNVLFPLAARLDGVLGVAGLQGEVRSELTVITALIDHLRQLAKNLELFARDPEQEGTEGITVLGPWCRRVQPLLESSLGAGVFSADRWIRLNCDVPEDLPPVAMAPHRLTQSVLNLVHNARDAIILKQESREPQAPRAGAITLQARASEDASVVILKLCDDGIGMNQETLRRCTEPFFTTKDRPAAGGPTQHRTGSGIGLGLVLAMVERVGGRLEIESEVGKGSTVSLVLPVARSHSARPEAAPPLTAGNDLKRASTARLVPLSAAPAATKFSAGPASPQSKT